MNIFHLNMRIQAESFHRKLELEQTLLKEKF